MVRLPEMIRLALGRDSHEGGGPDWVVMDLHGSYPTHRSLAPVQAVLQRSETFEGLAERLDRIGKTPWVKGVLVRVTGLTAGLATAEAIGTVLGRLAARKRVVAYLPHVSMRSLLATATLTEVVAPESAEVSVPGFAAEQVFFGAFLARHGVTFENLRIREYKSALTPFSQDHMDEFNREQLTAYLGSAEEGWLAALAGARGVGVERARAWLDADLTNADQLLEAGLITRIAYDDEIVTPVDPHWGRALELMRPQLSAKKLTRHADGVAVVPVVGMIVSGRSRGGPPLPFLGGPRAGSETVVAALRRAQRDSHTKAVVLFVDSGGGSALASDVICRAVATLGKPVVAVMGEIAGSGGYYVLAQADRIVASPYTLTGSIGVVVGKPVLTQFNERHGLNPEVVGRERALFASTARGFSEDQRAWAERMMREVYDRFVQRVATGRGLSAERVDEIGRGRIWSGRDALGIGLVDELGDLDAGIAAARRLAALADDAPVRTVGAGLALPGAPTFAREGTAALADLWPFGQERVLTWLDRSVTIR
ncbi:S49 family peptidase [Georgenia sp. SYP-B2076]|uniref:S49 family peptidase n=1 Tax=Georgenia sp. SYP-B2076 TaxID=2495881 RepID=UPI00197AB397|nr:S49 family peptidase [Georgenia sp. SYP-B2076]